MKYIKSPLNYTGGKYKLLSQILPLFPTNINKFVDLCSDLQKVQTNVANALKKLEGRDNIIRNIERMEELGAKDVTFFV